VPKARQKEFTQKDLGKWRLIRRFQAVLEKVCADHDALGKTWDDPRRELKLGNYLSSWLFAMFNPVIDTMRGLCAASHLEKVQEIVTERPISLGSFSEAQSLVDPELLRKVFFELKSQVHRDPSHSKGLPENAVAIDSTVWMVLPRMAWAFWRPQGGLQNAVRLHVEFDLHRGEVSDAQPTKAKVCERKQWLKMAKPGFFYIGDRYYSYDYTLLSKLIERGVGFLVRLRETAEWVEETCEVLTDADRKAGVVWAGTVRLGKAGGGPRVRVIRILCQDKSILLATSLSVEDATPELLSVCYRRRWEVELFFRWIKCILGCRHWLAESEEGVAIQIYMALIAAQLMVLYLGKLPNKRQMEAIKFYLMGWASDDELAHLLEKACAKKS
jgi:hypothetical protein